MISINKQLLQEMVENKFVTVQKHPEIDLFIYNYAPKVQYERVWNEITEMTRGLILDENDEIKARPFPKFFNYEELEPHQIPNETFEIYEKMDGSLGILYWVNNTPKIATRGSFTSEQAQFATKLLHQKYQHTFQKLDKNNTYLFEIIYPENRIVVDYGTEEKLVLLAIIDTETGRDKSLQDIGFEIVKKYNFASNFQEIKNLDLPNQEGFVIKFENDFRLKIKFEEYVRLHKIITQCSTITVWEYLSEGKSLDELLAEVPDEFYDWVKKTVQELQNQYVQIEKECQEVYKELPNRKETASYFLTQKYPSILFRMLDKKPYQSLIWKIIKPKFSKAFLEY